MNENSINFLFRLDLKHSQIYNISIRARNRLGQSRKSISIKTDTKDVPIEKEDLPQIEYSSIHFLEKSLDYRLNNFSFITSKVPLCLRIDIYNHSTLCERIVTSSGVIKLDENDLSNVLNVSICLDQYEDYCGQAIPVEMSKKMRTFSSHAFFSSSSSEREVAFNWIFILIASIIIVFFLILCGLCIFCLLQNRKRRRNLRMNFELIFQLNYFCF